MQAETQETRAVAELVERLVEAFRSKDVTYCHWKSNITLPRALAGDEDLDLLVDRESLSRALQVLADLGFKPAGPRSGPRPPGVRHFYGFDPSTGRLIHVHL